MMSRDHGKRAAELGSANMSHKSFAAPKGTAIDLQADTFLALRGRCRGGITETRARR